jgi:hypothetical protein
MRLSDPNGAVLYSNHDSLLDKQSVIRDTFHRNETRMGVSDRFHENWSMSVILCSFSLKLMSDARCSNLALRNQN